MSWSPQCAVGLHSVFMVFRISSFGLKEHYFIMSAKRNLPAWMVTSDHKSSKEGQSVKMKPEMNTGKGTGKKYIKKRMMYWMNEQELVETALSVLRRENGETAVGDRCAPLDKEVTVIPETDRGETTDSDVSEPAVDIAEQETVPYGNCLEEKRCSGASKCSGEQPVGSSAVLEKEVESEESDSDHEARQVLREIFFS